MMVEQNFRSERAPIGICVGCGAEFFHKYPNQGGGTARKWCSHNCRAKVWYQENKEKAKEQKRKSAAKPECKARKKLNTQLRKHLWKRQTPEWKLWTGAKVRAKEKNLDFTIQPKDVIIPERCPLLNIPLIVGSRSGNSPSVDRINPHGGYTPNNIWVISIRANTAKSNLSLSELKQLVENLEFTMTEKKIEETRQT